MCSAPPLRFLALFFASPAFLAWFFAHFLAALIALFATLPHTGTPLAPGKNRAEDCALSSVPYCSALNLKPPKWRKSALQPQVRNGRHARNCKLVVYPFSLHVSVGPVRTTGHAQHITRRTIMCAFAQKDTPGNIAKRVRNLTLYKPRPFPTFNTLHTGIVLIYSNDSCKANLMILSATSWWWSYNALKFQFSRSFNIRTSDPHTAQLFTPYTLQS